MNTTININLAGYAFSIDKDAYDLLQSYLESIKNQIDDNNADEVMRDIEARIAELFSDICRSQHTQVVTMQMVQTVVNQLGKPDDFKDDDQPAENAFTTMLKKKLYRDTDNALIGGVCSGIGHWLGLDAIWVRLIFLLCLLLWGITLPIYLILWLIVPEARTAAQRLNMRGELTTIENIEREVTQQRNNQRNSNSGCLGTALKIILLCIGGFFLFIAVIIFFSLITGIIGAFSGLAALSPLGIIGAFFSGDYRLSAILAILIVLIIALPVFLIALVIYKHSKQQQVQSRTIWITVIIWLVAICGSIGIGTYQLFSNDELLNEILFDDDLSDNDPQAANDVLSLSGFHSVSITGAADIKLTQADEYYAEGNNSFFKRAEVIDSVLYITTIDNLKKGGAKLWIQTPTLKAITIEGASKCKSNGMLSLDELSITAEGASKIDLRLQAKAITISALGASDIELEGTADNLNIEIEGAANIDADDLQVRNASVRADGPSRIDLFVTEQLETHASFLSKITNKGNPAIIK